jgi:hypothetical protein
MNCIKECHSNNMICDIHNMSCVSIVMTCGARSFVGPTCTKVYSFFFCKPNFSFHLQWTLLEEKENEMKIKNDIGDSKDVYHWKICHMLVTLTPSLIQVTRFYLLQMPCTKDIMHYVFCTFIKRKTKYLYVLSSLHKDLHNCLL